MKVGYIIVSNEIMHSGKKIRYIYREEPSNPGDSGWRAFSGEESKDFVDDSKNFAIYNARTIVEKFPEIAELLTRDYPVAFERNSNAGVYVEVIEQPGDEG